MTGQARLTIDDLTNQPGISAGDLLAGRDSIGDFKITYDNSLAGRNSTGYQNYIVDGDFNFWSNGGIFTASGYAADMWSFSKQAGTGSFNQQFHFNSNVQSYFARFTMDTATTNTHFLNKIKNVSKMNNRTVSVFMRLKSSTGLTTLSPQILQVTGTGTGDSFSGSEICN